MKTGAPQASVSVSRTFPPTLPNHRFAQVVSEFPRTLDVQFSVEVIPQTTAEYLNRRSNCMKRFTANRPGLRWGGHLWGLVLPRADQGYGGGGHLWGLVSPRTDQGFCGGGHLWGLFLLIVQGYCSCSGSPTRVAPPVPLRSYALVPFKFKFHEMDPE